MKKITSTISFKETKTIEELTQQDKKDLTDFFMLLYEWHCEEQKKLNDK